MTNSQSLTVSKDDLPENSVDSQNAAQSNSQASGTDDAEAPGKAVKESVDEIIEKKTNARVKAAMKEFRT